MVGAGGGGESGGSSSASSFPSTDLGHWWGLVLPGEVAPKGKEEEGQGRAWWGVPYSPPRNQTSASHPVSAKLPRGSARAPGNGDHARVPTLLDSRSEDWDTKGSPRGVTKRLFSVLPQGFVKVQNPKAPALGLSRGVSTPLGCVQGLCQEDAGRLGRGLAVD